MSKLINVVAEACEDCPYCTYEGYCTNAERPLKVNKLPGDIYSYPIPSWCPLPYYCPPQEVEGSE